MEGDGGRVKRRNERRPALGALEVERDAALVAVHRAIERRHGSGTVAEVARVVARPRVLDLDDVGAEVGEVERADRPGQQAREVEDAHAGKRSSGGNVAQRAASEQVGAGNAEIALDLARDGERVRDPRREAGDVAHLPAASRFGLAVEMELGLGMA